MSEQVPKSIWDADDDEFDSDVYGDLKKSIATMKSHRGTFKPSTTYQHPQLLPTYTFNNGVGRTHTTAALANLRSIRARPPAAQNSAQSDQTEDNDDGTEQSPSKRTQKDKAVCHEEQFRDYGSELNDHECMDPTGQDLHDKIMANIFTEEHPALPPYFPAGHMHLVDWEKLKDTDDIPMMEYVKPRLCDSVPTVLRVSGIEALNAFLDPNVEVFEWWRRAPHYYSVPSVVIRRDRHQVVVGTFRNLGFKYVWGYYVKCFIDLTGKWTVTRASLGGATTILSKNGVEWDSFDDAAAAQEDLDPNDPKVALSLSRSLGKWLLSNMAWKFDAKMDPVEWIVDGKVTIAQRNRQWDGEHKVEEHSYAPKVLFTV